MTRNERRVQLAASYVLHHRPYRDTSRVIEAFTREHGRLTLFARGVRGAKSRQAPLLQPFRPLLLSFLLGRGDAAQLVGVEPADLAIPVPAAAALMPAYYLNELLMKLLGRLDPQPQVFDAYARALAELVSLPVPAVALRRFEHELLQALGFGLDFADIEADATYRFDPGHGFAKSVQADAIAGADLLGLARGNWSEAAVLAAAARVLRAALDNCLDGAELKTRAVARALRRQVAR